MTPCGPAAHRVVISALALSLGCGSPASETLLVDVGTPDALEDRSGDDTPDVVDSSDVEPEDTVPPDLMEDVFVPPPYQCGLEKGVWPTEPVFEALPPYIGPGEGGLVVDLTGDAQPEILGAYTLIRNGTLVPQIARRPVFLAWSNAVGDFDGDGLWDVAGVFNYGEISIAYQTSPGVFAPKVVLLESNEYHNTQFTAANLNGDAKAALVNARNGRIQVFQLDPTTQTLELLAEVIANRPTYSTLRAVDITLDGRDEILFNGAFKVTSAEELVEIPGYPDPNDGSSPLLDYVPFDVELDGVNEIVGFTSNADMVVIRPGPEPTFEMWVSYFPYLGVFPLGDLDGDALDEMLVASDTEVALYSRRGPSEFEERARGRGRLGLHPPVVDIDLDGDLDVYGSGPILFENHGPLGFEAHDAPQMRLEGPSYEVASASDPSPSESYDAVCACLPAKAQGLAVDLDLDGMDDVVYASAQQLVVSRSLGDGRFDTPRSTYVGQPTDLRRWVGLEVEATDLTGDGRPELVLLTRNTEWHCDQRHLFAAFSVAPDFTLAAVPLPIDSPQGIDFGDVNEDGLVDIVSFHPFDTTATMVSSGAPECAPVEFLGPTQLPPLLDRCCQPPNPSAGVRVTRQTAPGVFEPGPLTTLRAVVPDNACTLDEGYAIVDGTLLDVTGDGHLDLVAAHAAVRPDVEDLTQYDAPCEWNCPAYSKRASWRIDGAFIVVHPGDGQGGFGPGRTIGGADDDAVRSLDHADIDGDGDEDVMVTTDLWSGFLVSPNAPMALPTLDGPVCEAALLLDLDSSPFQRRRLGWYASDWMRPANLNGDLCADFAPAIYHPDYDTGSVQSILGDGAYPAAWHTVPVPGVAKGEAPPAVTGDFNGDGLDDLYVRTTTWAYPEVRVLLNRTPRPPLRR
jgi:hypothetical protein